MIEMGVVSSKSGRGFEIFARIVIIEPPFKISCIRHCPVKLVYDGSQASCQACDSQQST